MKPRHAVALALAGCCLIVSGSSVAADAKPKFSTYTNETYGISFRYPSEWTLKEGDQAKLNLGYLGEVDPHLPEGVTIVAVQMPGDSYPGTNLGLAFLNASVDTSLSDALCNFGSPKVEVGTIEFTNHEDGDGGLGHGRVAEYYHVFQNSICYEFELGQTSNYQEDKKPVDYNAVFRSLRRVLATVRIRPTKIARRSLKSK